MPYAETSDVQARLGRELSPDETTQATTLLDDIEILIKARIPTWTTRSTRRPGRQPMGERERCNYAKEAPGWRVTAADENGVHAAEFVTPTGARYRSTAPALPGGPMIGVSEVEIRIGVAPADLRAA